MLPESLNKKQNYSMLIKRTTKEEREKTIRFGREDGMARKKGGPSSSSNRRPEGNLYVRKKGKPHLLCKRGAAARVRGKRYYDGAQRSQWAHISD